MKNLCKSSKICFKKGLRSRPEKQKTMRQHKETEMNEGDGGGARHERLDVN